MERHGRLLCRAPEAQQIAMSGASGPLRLLIPQGGGPTMLKCLRGGPEAPDFAGGDDSAWRLTLLPASAGCAPRLRAGRERFGALCSCAWRASAIRAPRPNNSCLLPRICAPRTRVSPLRSITAISVLPAAWSSLTRNHPSRSRRLRKAGRGSYTASVGCATCGSPAASCRANRPRPCSVIF